MKKLLVIIIILGVSLFLIGYFLNVSLLKIATGNIYGASDNSIEKHVLSLNQENIGTSDNITLLTFPDQLCIFYDEINGIPVSDNIEVDSIIGKAFYYENIIKFPDLVDLDTYGISTIGAISLRNEPAIWLKYMTDNIKSENISYTISSGFRDYPLQEYIFNYKVASSGIKYAQKYAAKPGFSEHHLGTTIDILTYENNLKQMPTYTKTKLFTWLKKNSFKYGFIESYPQGKSTQTGFEYEPWHYRYVGLDLAKKIIDSKITLYEFLSSQYNYCIVE